MTEPAEHPPTEFATVRVQGGSKSNFQRWFIAAIAALTIIGGLVFVSVQQIIKDNRQIAEHYSVLTNLSKMQASLMLMHASGQSFRATSEETYLSSFRTSQLEAEEQLRRLVASEIPGDDSGKNFIELGDKTKIYIAAAEKNLNNSSITNKSPSVKINRERLDEIISLVNTFRQFENEKASENSRSMQSNVMYSLVLGLTTLIGCVSLFSLMFWRMLEERRNRITYEKFLQESNHRLATSLEELRWLNEKTKVLNILGEFLLTCRSVEEAFTVLSKNIQQLMPDMSGQIALLNPSHDNVKVVEAWGEHMHKEWEFSPEECWGLRRGRMHYSSHNRADPSCRHFEDTSNEMLCVPLVAQGETMGVMCLMAPEGEEIVESTRQIALTLAEQTSLAMANLRLQETLRMQSVRDQLTGLYNRRYLEESLSREIARCRRQKTSMAIAMVDMDHFKQFNDTNGHEAGDMLLSEFGRLLKGFVRTEDIACRYGGEEFTIILPGASLEVGTKRMEELRELVKKMHILYRGRSLGNLSISAGVATFPDHGESGNSVIAMADTALYKAKQTGRDRVVSAEELEELQPNIKEVK